MKHMNSVRIIALGGSADVTRNMYAYEYRQSGSITDILLVDCGVGFPDATMQGIDYLIPDISYLEDKIDKIRGLVLTHGHMDHIGALKYIAPQLNNPQLYGTRLTAALADANMREFGIPNSVKVVDEDQVLNLAPFRVSFVHVTHSIPDATNLIIETPIGKFYHGSDYKFDWSPIDGRPTEVNKIVNAAGKDGFLCLLSDCVRSENSGYTLSEKIIDESLNQVLQRTQGKLIFATFSSNISRIQQAVDVAVKNNRLICFIGRSIRNNVEIAKRLKYLRYPKQSEAKENMLSNVPDSKLMLIVTGSQGETGSALTRIANEEHKRISTTAKDKVIISADPIPGNETAVNNVINSLSARETEVIYTDIHDALHVSGHGSKGDIALMLGLTRPKYSIPIGGEHKQMAQFKKIAMALGHNAKNIFIPKGGEVVTFEQSGNAFIDQPITLRDVMVDGYGIGDIDSGVLNDRRQLAQEGFVNIVIPLSKSKELDGVITIITRGFVFHDEKESKELLNKARSITIDILNKQTGDNIELKHRITKQLKRFFYDETGRNPLILPVIVQSNV